MKRFLYEVKCKCKEETTLLKKRKTPNRTEGKAFLYPHSNELISKTFEIRYEKELSTFTKILLSTFQNKYLYYAIDDILYMLKSNPSEQNNILAILYSPVISLQNNYLISFFDIWIHKIYISEVVKSNKFLSRPSENFESFSYIKIIFLYQHKSPLKKQEILW